MTEDNFEEFLKNAACGYNAPAGSHLPGSDMLADPGAARGGSACRVRRRIAGARIVGAEIRLEDLDRRGGGSRSSARDRCRPRAVERFVEHHAIGGRQSAEDRFAFCFHRGCVAERASWKSASDCVGRDKWPRTRDIPRPAGSAAKREGGGQTESRKGWECTARCRRTPDAFEFRIRVPAHRGPASQRSGSASHFVQKPLQHGSADGRAQNSEVGRASFLSNTRLLLDSPVANDPQRRPLLEDLELVLVQIVQLSPGSTPQDRDLIEKTLQHDHVMTRLRTAIPAGSQRGS